MESELGSFKQERLIQWMTAASKYNYRQNREYIYIFSIKKYLHALKQIIN